MNNVDKNNNDFLTSAILAKWQQHYCNEEQSLHLDQMMKKFDFSHAPQIYIQYASAELIGYQIEAFIAEGQKMGAELMVSNYPALFHIFQIVAMQSPEGRQAIADLCNFLQEGILI